MRLLSWDEFDESVQIIAKECSNKKFQGVYGFPRGGLCLAVALSHSLGIPLLIQPIEGSLIVDDVYETGKTINLVKSISDITVFVWLSKVSPEWWKAVEITNSDEWLVFPWENRFNAQLEEQVYRASSKLK